ncbi:MAG: lactococcin 972 family bacteriocin [Eubacteriales bacterium]|nr:lactococcin 972 family bacteriocin [Eubacteriales bacterium]
MQNRKFKKLSAFIAVAMLSAVTVGTTAFANPQLLFDSEEGIGIEVHCSNARAEGDIDDNYTSVSGGTLWTTWRKGTSFRANYDHASKEHRCTAQNGDGETSRSAWTTKGNTARSEFIRQTLINNRCYASTR